MPACLLACVLPPSSHTHTHCLRAFTMLAVFACLCVNLPVLTHTTAMHAAAGKDTLDFYGDPAARALYKLHIWGMLSRINPLTGLAPKDDPAIFSFNIINEPRCPGGLCVWRGVAVVRN